MSTRTTAPPVARVSVFVVVVAVIAGFGRLLFGFDTGVISGAILFIAQEFHMSAALESFTTSAVILGAVIGAANVIGMFTDFFQRTITDVGAVGPDRARGGLFLLLPPDYDGEVPKGYFAFKSPTYNVFLFFRTIMKKGEDGPDPKPAVALARKTRVYPLFAAEN